MQNEVMTSSTLKDNSTKACNDRRKRVNRIKTVIIILVIVCMLLPTIFCILLGLQVNRLQKQVDELVGLHGQYGLSDGQSGEDYYAYAAEKDIAFAAQQEGTAKQSADNTLTEQMTTENGLDPSASSNQDGLPSENESVKTTSEQTAATDAEGNSNPTDQKGADNGISENSSEAAKKSSKEDGTDKKTGKYTGKKVYLTFDDGPSVYTDDILDILSEYQVKATFFVIGKEDSWSKKMYQRIVEEEHTLGMHSYSHQYSRIYNSVEDFDKDFTKLQKLLYDTTGYKPTIYRFPGGSDNQVNKNGMEDFIRYLNDAGVVYFDWNVLNGDATGVEYTKKQLINNVLSGVETKENSIVLMHDSQVKKSTVDSLPGLLDSLISEGAQILPLDDTVTPIQMIKADTIE